MAERAPPRPIIPWTTQAMIIGHSYIHRLMQAMPGYPGVPSYDRDQNEMERNFGLAEFLISYYGMPSATIDSLQQKKHDILRWFVGVLTSLCHSNGDIETMPAREINPFIALTRIRPQFLRTQWSTSNHQRVDTTTPQTAEPSGLAWYFEREASHHYNASGWQWLFWRWPSWSHRGGK